MKWLLILVALLMSGCMTTYDIKACNQDTNVCTTVMVKSFREFEQPTVVYSRDEESVSFSFGATAATTANSPLEQAAAEIITSLPVLLAPPAGE